MCVGTGRSRGVGWKVLAEPNDMLPLGLQKPPNGSPWPRPNGLTLDEQRTLMTLWGVTRSPLIYGGRLDNMSQHTVDLLTHPAIIALSQHAVGPPRPVFPPPPNSSSDLGTTYQGLG